PIDQRLLHLLVLAEQPVDDLVARDRRRPVARERCERLALPRPDAAGDGDRERTPRGHLLRCRRRFTLGVAGSRLLRSFLIGLDALVELLVRRRFLGRLGPGLLGERLLGERLLGDRLPGERLLGDRLLGERRLGEDLLRELEVRRALDGFRLVRALRDTAALDALE